MNELCAIEATFYFSTRMRYTHTNIQHKKCFPHIISSVLAFIFTNYSGFDIV